MCAAKFLWPDPMSRTNMPQYATSAPRKEIAIYHRPYLFFTSFPAFSSSTCWRTICRTCLLLRLVCGNPGNTR